MIQVMEKSAARWKILRKRPGPARLAIAFDGQRPSGLRFATPTEENVMNTGSPMRHVRHVLLLSLGLSGAAMAEPVGDLLPLTETGVAIYAMSGKTVDDVRGTIPSRETVGLPVYPGAFYTSRFDGEGMLPWVIMASSDPVEIVKAWYADQEGLTWNDMFELFHAGDTYEMMAVDSVLLQDISDDPSQSTGGLAGFDMSGMKTQITIAYTPKDG